MLLRLLLRDPPLVIRTRAVSPCNEGYSWVTPVVVSRQRGGVLRGRAAAPKAAAALVWYRKAADQGYANAQFNLGTMYHQGNSVPQSYKEALVWYRKAADQGYSGAQ